MWRKSSNTKVFSTRPTLTLNVAQLSHLIMGSIFSAIGGGINAVISAIANVIMTIVSAITTVSGL